MLPGSVGLIENSIKDWVRQQVCLVDADHGRCKKIVVRHLNIENKATGDVHTINIVSDPAMPGPEIADKVIMEICEAAQRDADDLKAGVQKYGIYAYFTKSASYAPRKIFRTAAEEDFDPNGGPSEPPTDKGIIVQLMRHNETNMKNSMVGMGYILQTFQKEIKEQREENRQYRNQQIDLIVLTQEVMNDAHKRRLEEKKAEIEISMIEGVFEHLKVALPLLVNKLANKEVFAPKMDSELYMLASFLENLTEEQQNFLRNKLSPQQLAQLAELLGAYEARKAKLTGEKPPSEIEEGEPSPDTSGRPTKPLARKPANSFLKLFEPRKRLVEAGLNLAITDEVVRDFEAKAEKIRSRSRAIADVGNDDKE